jgi:hypothetical protein
LVTEPQFQLGETGRHALAAQLGTPGRRLLVPLAARPRSRRHCALRSALLPRGGVIGEIVGVRDIAVRPQEQ